MKLDSMKDKKLDDDKINKIIENILSNDADSYPEKYSGLEIITKSLSESELVTLAERVKEMFNYDSHSALMFVYYGKLKGLEEELEKLLDEDTHLAIYSLGTLSDIGSIKSYDKIKSMLDDDSKLETHDNAVLSLLKLDFDRALPTFTDYLRKVDGRSAWFVGYNLVYANYNNIVKRRKIEDILSLRADSVSLVQKINKTVEGMIDDYGIRN